MLEKYLLRYTTKIDIKINYCFALVKLEVNPVLVNTDLRIHLHAVVKMQTKKSR